jgi:hypothetical protein
MTVEIYKSERRILDQAEKIKAKLQWLAEHPGKTRNDYAQEQGLAKWSLKKAEKTRSAIADFLRNNKGTVNDEEVKEAVQWILPRNQDKAAELVHEILKEMNAA